MTIDDVGALVADESRTMELKKSTGGLKDGMHAVCAFLKPNDGWLFLSVIPKSHKIIRQSVTYNTKRENSQVSTAQRDAVDEIIRNATQQTLDILNKLGEDKDSFCKHGLTFEEKSFYDFSIHLRETHNFEYGEDIKHGSLIILDRCKSLAKTVKEPIDTKSSFSDWLANKNVRAKLNQDLFFSLATNDYTPQWSDEVLDQVLDQVENFKENTSSRPHTYDFPYSNKTSIAAEP